MIPVPASLRQTSHFLRRLLLVHWLGVSLLISSALMLYDISQRHKRIIGEGDQVSRLVAASLRIPMTTAKRQQLLEAYSLTERQQRFDRINLLLVIDRSGRIIYTSRSTWQAQSISDPLFDQMAGTDVHFRQVIQCFRRQATDCVEMRSEDWTPQLSGITVVRPVSMPARDLGLPRQPFLVLINFDDGMLIGDVLQDVPSLLLFACLLAAVLVIALWHVLSGRLIPQLMEVSQTDALTQLMNRTSFMELAMELLAEAEEHQGELVFAILDIDHFKRINDTYGHDCGDAALASVGALLLTVTRPQDLVCRFGGEEFAMLLSASREAGHKALERLRLQLEMNKLLHNGHRIPLTVSIGAVATHECGFNIDFLYNTADKALYTAKRGGRNRLEWNSGQLVTRLHSPSALTH